MTHLVTTAQGKQFSVNRGEALLDAALRQGVTLNYSCRTGRCSSCKGKILSGETSPLHAELGLTATERAAGYVLTCVRQAQSQVTLEIDDLGEIDLPETKTLPCRIHALNFMSHDVLCVVLRVPPASPMDFLPGQYVEVIGDNGLRRSYSLANAPRADRLLELHIRKVADGAMSRYWFGMAKVNDLLRLRGPMGTFFLRGQTRKDLSMLATGTGIAPVKAILEGLANAPASEQPRSVTVYWGGRRKQDLYWQVPASRNWLFVPVLSRAGPDWTGSNGHVQDAMLAAQPDLLNTLVYACGADAMIRSAEAQLRAAGLPDRQFHSDAFVCSAVT